MGKIANWMFANGILGTSETDLMRCPTYSDILANGGELKAGYSYDSNQLIEEESFQKKPLVHDYKTQNIKVFGTLEDIQQCSWSYSLTIFDLSDDMLVSIPVANIDSTQEYPTNEAIVSCTYDANQLSTQVSGMKYQISFSLDTTEFYLRRYRIRFVSSTQEQPTYFIGNQLVAQSTGFTPGYNYTVKDLLNTFGFVYVLLTIN